MISCPSSAPLSEASAPSECDSPLTAFEETHTDVDRFSLSLPHPLSFLPLSFSSLSLLQSPLPLLPFMPFLLI